MVSPYPQIPANPVSFDPRAKPGTRAFRAYEPGKLIRGKSMASWLPFAVCWWHTFIGDGTDPFGGGTRLKPFGGAPKDMDDAKARVVWMFQLLNFLGIKYYCWHDMDIIPTPRDLKEYLAFMDEVGDFMLEQQKVYGVQCLWGTANLFSAPFYAEGAASNPSVAVFETAAAQVKKAMELTAKLGGKGYVFWGGREGYNSMWTASLPREMSQLAAFFRMAALHATTNYPRLQLLIEPKPAEPSMMQYDRNVDAVMAFLLFNGLDKSFKINIETNHAELAGVEMMAEMEKARAYKALGSLDLNVGHPSRGVGWDVDKFLVLQFDLATQIALSVIWNGGLPVGMNFDAKIRRYTWDVLDGLVDAHVGGMDAMAVGLRVAGAMLDDGIFDTFHGNRYGTWDQPEGQAILSGGVTLDAAASKAYARNTFPTVPCGQEERVELLVQQYILATIRQLAA